MRTAIYGAGSLGTVMGGTFGDVTADPRARELAVRCMNHRTVHAAGSEERETL